MNKLETLVYTSTLFSNSNRKRDIDEIVYELPFKAEEAVRLARNGDEDALNVLFSKCNPKFHNFYTFSKCVSENLLVEKASDLPVSIVRPSLIIACMGGSLPGYVEDGSALVNLVIGIGKGLLHVFKMYGGNKLEFIPADIAANTHVVAAFFQGYKRFPSPRVYNCTSGNMAEHSWSEFGKTILELAKKNPLPNSFIIPSLTFCNSAFAYKFYAFIYHTLPATIIDLFLWIAGKKFRLLKLYNFQERMLKIGEPFIENQWNFSCDNFVSLSEKLNETDAEIFNVDVRKFRMKDYTVSLYNGSPFYRVNNKIYKDTFSAWFLRYFITYFLQFLVFGSIATLLYIVF